MEIFTKFVFAQYDCDHMTMIALNYIGNKNATKL